MGEEELKLCPMVPSAGFYKYVLCYDAIQTLANNGITDEEEKAVHEHNLLFQIIERFKEYLEDGGVEL